MRPAVSGDRGHDAAYRAACALVLGFNLTPGQAAWIFWRYYNSRCIPPWTEDEIWHKVEDADRQPGDRGYLFRRNDAPSAQQTGRLEVLKPAEVEVKRVSWVWPARIPRGKLCLLAGVGGVGKSLVTVDIASRVSRGTAWPDTAESAAGDVAILSAEDDPADTIVPRLKAAGADLDRVRLLYDAEGDFSLAAGLEQIRQIASDLPNCKLLVVDPITAYLGGGVDSNRDSSVRQLMAPLSQLAAETETAILLVAHVNKADRMSAMFRVSGSVAFVNAVRLVWGFGWKGESGHMVELKRNIGTPVAGLEYRIQDNSDGQPVVEWRGISTQTAEQVFE